MADASGLAEAVGAVPVRHIDLPQYVRYCERKLDEYEQERRDLLASLDTLRTPEQIAQELRWALRQKEDEVLQLQLRAAEAQRGYLEARADADLLLNENRRLRSQEAADRQKIAELLQMTCPKTEAPPEPRPPAPLPAPDTLTRYSTQLLLETLAANRPQGGSAGEGGPILSAAESSLVIEFWTQYGKQEEEARLEAARQHEQLLSTAKAYFQDRADRDAQEIARLQAALTAATQTLCQYRHHAQITHRGLQKSLFETHEEMRRRVEELTHEKERQALRLQGALEEAQQQDQQHIAHLQRVAQEQDVQFYEQLQAVADSKHRMAAKVKRAKSQLSELKWRCERLSQFRYYCLKGYESELQLLARHVEQLEKKLYYSLRPAWHGGTDGWVALQAMADSSAETPPPPPLSIPADADGTPHSEDGPTAAAKLPRPKKGRRDGTGRSVRHSTGGPTPPPRSKELQGRRRVTFSAADPTRATR